VGWGGVASVFLAWTSIERPAHLWGWLGRAGLALIGAIALRWIAMEYPEFVMPLYDRVNYSDTATCPSCSRTTQTLVESMMWLGFTLGGWLAELLRRDWRNVQLILTMSLGFGLAFAGFNWFHTLHDISSLRLSWWKYWESTVGLLGGITLGVCFCLFNRPVRHPSGGQGCCRRVFCSPYVESLLGVWLPLLLSLYMFLSREIDRFMGLLAVDGWPELTVVVPVFVAAVLIAVGLVVILRTMRMPAADLAHDRIIRPDLLFVVPYVLMFLVSYARQFLKAKDPTVLAILVAIYGFNFLMGLALFWRIRRRSSTGRPGLEQPVDAPAIV
jgi:hypothetical protein